MDCCLGSLSARRGFKQTAIILAISRPPEFRSAVVPLGPLLLNQLDGAQRPVFFRSMGPEVVLAPEVVDQLAAVEDVVLIGYPSGLHDEQNSSALIRRGITASPVWNNLGGDPVFSIDEGGTPDT